MIGKDNQQLMVIFLECHFGLTSDTINTAATTLQEHVYALHADMTQSSTDLTLAYSFDSQSFFPWMDYVIFSLRNLCSQTTPC